MGANLLAFIIRQWKMFFGPTGGGLQTCPKWELRRHVVDLVQSGDEKLII